MNAATSTTARRELTRTDREYLQHLLFRRHQVDGVQGAFVFELPRGRWGLIVRTLFGDYALAHQWNKNRRTIDQLAAAGLVEIGPGRSLPEPFAPGGYGHPITITGLGVHAVRPESRTP